MKVKELLPEVRADTFINDYLQSLGIDNVDLFVNPNTNCLDKLDNYLNIDKMADTLHEVICCDV